MTLDTTSETETKIRLTELVTCGGCAAKAQMGHLAQALQVIPRSTNPRVLVDARTSDDAGVFRLSDEIALVQTVDFFTPLVDDPYVWGAIAATNALSDVYAMGGTPITALNVAAFPLKTVSVDVLAEVIRGASDKCQEAGVAVLGGHTIEDDTPKFGVSVTGVVHPDRIVTNAGGQVGDVLVLTKPLGLGITNSAIKQQFADADQYAHAVRVMTTLNRAACAAMLEVGVHAATDVTGFGLLGHLSEVCAASSVGAVIYAEELPLLRGLAELRARGATTRTPKQIYSFLGTRVRLDDQLDPLQKEVVADPQTSGGLLLCVAADRADALMEALKKRGVDEAAIIGELTQEPGIVVMRQRASA